MKFMRSVKLVRWRYNTGLTLHMKLVLHSSWSKAVKFQEAQSNYTHQYAQTFNTEFCKVSGLWCNKVKMQKQFSHNLVLGYRGRIRCCAPHLRFMRGHEWTRGHPHRDTIPHWESHRERNTSALCAGCKNTAILVQLCTYTDMNYSDISK